MNKEEAREAIAARKWHGVTPVYQADVPRCCLLVSGIVIARGNTWRQAIENAEEAMGMGPKTASWRVVVA